MSTATPTADATASVELRASVLDAAINLGFRNSMMVKWMLEPGADGEAVEHANPGLMTPSSSASTTSHSTSEDSSMSPYNFRLFTRLPNPNPKLGMIDEQASALDSAGNLHFVRPSVDNAHPDDAKPPESRKLRITVPTVEEMQSKQRGVKGGYESDGGYKSEGERKGRSVLRWKRKDVADGYGSDELGGSKSTKKSKTKGKKNKEDESALSSDPEAFLATVNASLLPQTSRPDGYLTDSAASSAGRGRLKKVKEKKTRTRPPSPSGGEEESPTMTPPRKRSLFRMMTRSSSKDKDRERRPDPTPPPPVPPLPTSLPIAERFARAGTPIEGPANTFSSSTAKPPSLSTTTSSLEVRNARNAPQNPSNDTLSPNADAARSVSPLSLPDLSNRDVARDAYLWNSDALIRGSERAARSMDVPSPTTQRVEDKSEESVHREKSPPRPGPSSPAEATGKTKVRRKLRNGFFAVPGGSLFSAEGGPSKLSTATISAPNPHVTGDRPTPTPLEIAAALNSRAASPTSPTDRNKLSPNLAVSSASSPSARTSDSYVFVDVEERSATPVGQQPREDSIQRRNSNYNAVPSSAFVLPSSPSSSPPGSSPPRSGLAARRSANSRSPVPPRALVVTPTQDRAGTPGGQDEFRAQRASVLAYYQIPPPSPPPTGPLPRVPDAADLNVDALRRPSADRQFLSPARAYDSRSPSPLRSMSPTAGRRAGAYSPTPVPARPTSPGIFDQPIPPVRRGKESPFPTRPILPPQDGRELVSRVAYYKALYVDLNKRTEGGGGADDVAREYTFGDEGRGMEEEDDADAMASSEEFVDTRSSAYIREARARGEKRVYFAHVVAGDGPDVIPEVSVEGDGDDSGIGVGVGGNDVVDDDDDDMSDRRSLGSASVYSRYSVLDAERSAQVRDGFVRRVGALYDADADLQRTATATRTRGRGRWEEEEIPDVPALPAGLRERTAPSYLTDRKGFLKASSSFRS
ncbi:hypothetical protein M0805_007767 [Coniferiporia weirii]|nr:hypothetical protein M0805_007767 [Coniferiporia weirii]